MSMDHPEGFGSASASEVPARPPGPGYNFRPRSRSATAEHRSQEPALGTRGTPRRGVHTRPAIHNSANFPYPQWSGKSHSCKLSHSENKHRDNFTRLDHIVESAIFPADARHSRGRDEFPPFRTDAQPDSGWGQHR